MDQNSIIKSYKRVSSFYDMTFGQVFRPGQKTVINKMNCQPSDSVLEIGIGTGLSFKYYPDETKVIGIDINKEKCKKNVTLSHLPGANQHFPHIQMRASFCIPPPHTRGR